METALAVRAGWLEGLNNAVQTTTNGLGCESGQLTKMGGMISDYSCYIPYNGYWPWTYQVVSSPARPIKLTMSEVDRLRKAAKADKNLKTILSKFTDQIEIVVDFE